MNYIKIDQKITSYCCSHWCKIPCISGLFNISVKYLARYIDPLLLPLIISDNLHSDCPLLRKKLDLKQKNIFYLPIKLLPKHLQLIESYTQGMGLVRTVMSSCLSRSHFLIMVSREPENSSCPLMAKDWIPSQCGGSKFTRGENEPPSSPATSNTFKKKFKSLNSYKSLVYRIHGPKNKTCNPYTVQELKLTPRHLQDPTLDFLNVASTHFNSPRFFNIV